MADEDIEKQVLNDVPEDSHALGTQAEDSHALGIQAEDSHPLRIQAEDSHHAEIQAKDLPPELQAEDSHPPEIQADDSHLPEIEADDSHPLEIQAKDSHPSEILVENSHPHEFQGPENDLKDDSAVNSLVIDDEKKWPGWPGENVFRMLVPVHKVGSIIGRKGEYIKKTCEETKACIKILDGPPGTTERTVMISAKEEPDAAIPPAMDGLLKVHKRIVDVDTDPAHAAPAAGGTISTRMLVAATQAGSLIGKQGATIKSIQDSSSCIIKVLGGENLPVFALPDDSVVEVQGESSGVHKAVELIAAHLRKFLVDRSVIGIFEMQIQNLNARGNQDVPLPQSWGPPPQGFPINSGGGPGFVPNQQYMPPERPFDNYYPPIDKQSRQGPPARQFDNYYPPMDKQSRQGPPARQFDNYYPPMDKQSRQGPPAYGRDVSIWTDTPSMQPQQSMVTKVSQSMQIPLTYADAVIGNSGTNISYIRRTSGASIAVQEGIPGEMTVEINGSASQVQTAVQLIQNFVAEAASAAQNPPGPPPPGQGYNSYSNDGPAYSSQPLNAGHAHEGEYGAVYGNYGY